MTWLFRYSIRHPRLVIAVAVLITLAAAPGMLRLRIRTDGHALVPVDAPEIKRDRVIRDLFDIEDQIVILVRSNHADGVFNVHTLELVQTLSRAFAEIAGVNPSNIFCLDTERSDRVKPGTLIFREFLNPLPRTPHQLDTLRDDLRAIELFTGTLVSADETATAIMVGVPAEADRDRLLATIRDIVTSQGTVPETIHIIGAPVAEALLGTHILEDLGVPTAVLGHRTYGDGGAEWKIPDSFHELRVLIGRKIGLVPVALVVMSLVFVVSFRSVEAVVLPLTEVGACLIAVFGLMGYADVPVYLTIAVLPVILTAIGVADEIHILKRYVDGLRERPDDDHIDVLVATMTEMRAPVVKTSVTTSVGFLSFALSPIGPVQAFGVLMAVGIMFCMFWSLTVIPALLSMINPRSFAGRRQADGAAVEGCAPFFSRFGKAAVRLRYPVVLAALIVVAVAPSGVGRVVVQDSWIDGFAPDSEFRRATTLFNEQFLGTHILLVAVDTRREEPLSGEVKASALDHREVRLPAEQLSDPGRLVGWRLYLERPDKPPEGATRPRPHYRFKWNACIETVKVEGNRVVLGTARKKGSPKLSLRAPGEMLIRYEIMPERLNWPEPIRRIGELEAFIKERKEDAVGGVLGTAAYMSTANFMSRGRREGTRRIPETPDRIQWIWGQYGRARGEARLRQAVDADYDRALVTVYLSNANFVATARLMDAIRDYEREHLTPHGIKLEFAGDVAVSQTLIGAIVTTQIRSLLFSLVGIFLITAAMSRSLLWGLLSVLPCALAVLVNFAVMGIASVPLGVATSMFSGMTLGIGVDYAIHLLERFRLARSRGLAGKEAVVDAVGATGPAIFIDAVAVALGFGVMTLSQVPANARLGALVALSIAGCFLATLLLLPALLRLFFAGRGNVASPLVGGAVVGQVDDSTGG